MREREESREERDKESDTEQLCMHACVCVCVWVKKKNRLIILTRGLLAPNILYLQRQLQLANNFHIQEPLYTVLQQGICMRKEGSEKAWEYIKPSSVVWSCAFVCGGARVCVCVCVCVCDCAEVNFLPAGRTEQKACWNKCLKKINVTQPVSLQTEREEWVWLMDVKC